MGIQHLAINQPATLLQKVVTKYQQCGLGRILSAAEHRFATKNSPQRQAVHPTNQFVTVPNFNSSDDLRMFFLQIPLMRGAVFNPTRLPFSCEIAVNFPFCAMIMAELA